MGQLKHRGTSSLCYTSGGGLSGRLTGFAQNVAEKRVKKTVSTIVLAALLIGCERSQTAGPATQPAGNPQTSAAHIAPATAPTTGPIVRAPSILLIDQKPLTFPPALVQLRSRDGQLTAILMSDDPKDAIEDNYHGNSFYIEMPLEIADGKDLANYEYRYTAPSSDRTDTPNGIFLDGNRIQLEPASIQVTFSAGEEGAMSVKLAGNFQRYETRDDSVSPSQVHVMAQLDAQLKKK